MIYHKKLIGKKCYLSPLAETDAEHWTRWYNDFEISMPECNVYDVLSKAKIQEFVNGNVSDMAPCFTVVNLETHEPIGLVQIWANQVFRNGSFAVIIGEKEYWGQGYGREAVELVLDFAFNCLNLHNMMLGVYEFNVRALKLYERIGFKEIGRKREHQTIAGKRYDMIMMDLLASEYKSIYVKPAMEQLEKKMNFTRDVAKTE